MPSPDANLLALIKLLADDHPEVVEAARAKLVEMGARVVPFLEQAAASDPDSKVRVEARGVLERIRLEGVTREWKESSSQSDKSLDLETGVFLLARVRYPELEVVPCRNQLDEMARQIRLKLRPGTRLAERLVAVNRYLFEGQGFRGNWDDYFDPQNSYLNRVLERKLGIPISLSVLYLLVAQRLKLPLKGVGIPGHFMVKAEDGGTEIYIDPFNGGRFLSRPECVQFIVEAGYPYQPEFLEGVRSREVLARMLRNLVLIYVDRHEETLEKAMTRFLDLLYPGRPSGAKPEGEA